MKKLFASLLLCAIAFAAPAQVTILSTNQVMTGSTNDTTINVKAVNNPIVWRGRVYRLPKDGTNVFTTNGVGTMVLVPGKYIGAYAGIPQSFQFDVTNSASTLNLTDLIESGHGVVFYSGVETLEGAGGIIITPPTGAGGHWVVDASGIVGSGTGDVLGPASSQQHHLVGFANTTGKSLEDTGLFPWSLQATNVNLSQWKFWTTNAFAALFDLSGTATAATNGYPWGALYDAVGAATAATNGLSLASGAAAFANTNRFLPTNNPIAGGQFMVTNSTTHTYFVVSNGAVTNSGPVSFDGGNIVSDGIGDLSVAEIKITTLGDNGNPPSSHVNVDTRFRLLAGSTIQSSSGSTIVDASGNFTGSGAALTNTSDLTVNGTNNLASRSEVAQMIASGGGGGGGGSGSVTSVGMSVPQGFAISGSPVTTVGTLALSRNGGNDNLLGGSLTNARMLVATNQLEAGGFFPSSTNVVQFDTPAGAKKFQFGTNGNAYFGGDLFTPIIKFTGAGSTNGMATYTTNFFAAPLDVSIGNQVWYQWDGAAYTPSWGASGTSFNIYRDFTASGIADFTAGYIKINGGYLGNGPASTADNVSVGNDGSFMLGQGAFQIDNAGSIAAAVNGTFSGTLAGQTVKVSGATANTLPYIGSGFGIGSIANPSGPGAYTLLKTNVTDTPAWVPTVNATALKASQYVATDGTTNLVSTQNGNAWTNLVSHTHEGTTTNITITFNGLAPQLFTCTNGPSIGQDYFIHYAGASGSASIRFVGSSYNRLHFDYQPTWLSGSNNVITNGTLSITSYGGTNAAQLVAAIREKQ